MNEYENFDSSSPSSSSAPLSVSSLNSQAKFLLEQHFPSILVEGEISNLARPASGHWYFTLKDKRAQIRCAFFKGRNQRVRFNPANGNQILIKAKLSLYEGRGDYQLIVEKMEELGDGALLREFEALKAQLLQEGLFSEEAKQQIPEHPKHIGVITSPTGAAIKDILSILNRRFPAICVTIIPVSVQGKNSAPQMVAAIKLANRKTNSLHDLDVLIIGRGGGSLEDLWSFNDEALARAIFNSKLPIISAIGHEVDFTIADFVADMRAPTPSAAAELISPDFEDYLQLFLGYQQHFHNEMRRKLQGRLQQLNWLSKQLKHPNQKIQDQSQRLDNLDERFRLLTTNRLQQLQWRLENLNSRFKAASPKEKLNQYSIRHQHFQEKLIQIFQQQIQNKKQYLAELSHALNTVSPLSTLARGYGISYDKSSNVLIKEASQVKPGQQIMTHLAKGKLLSTVEKVYPEETDTGEQC